MPTITHYYTPRHRLARCLQDEYPNGIVHYCDNQGEVIAFARVDGDCPDDSAQRARFIARFNARTDRINREDGR